MNIVIENVAADELSCARWTFMLIDNKLVLDIYTEYTRPSKRHNFVCNDIYSLLNDRSTTINLDYVKSVTDSTIFARAKALLMDQITVQYEY